MVAEASLLDGTIQILESPGDKDLKYGFSKWRPNFLQVLNNIKTAVFFISLAHCIQNAANGLLGVSISTLEKRFNFSSFMSSIIASSYEFGQVPAIIFIMVYGHKIHRPLFFGLGMLSVGVGCFLFFLPQFLLPTYVPSFLDTDSDRVNLCVASELEKEPAECLQTETKLSRYLPFFTIARFLIGMGATPILTAGITYINDCATKADFALYSGIYNAMSIVGPGIGVLLSSLLLNVYVDFYRVDVQGLGFGDDDPRWIGNWWLCYIFLFALSILSALPLFGFPNDLPGAKETRTIERQNESKSVNNGNNNKKTSTSLARKVMSLLRNPSYLLTCTFSFCDMFIIIGFNSFGPKIFENILNVPPHISGMVFGLVLLPSGMVGTILGGVIIQKFQLTCKKIIKIQTIISILTLLILPTILINCQSVRFAGSNYPLSASDQQMSLQGSCNSPCQCTQAEYQPICGIDGIQYFSPCHAGCHSKVYSEELNAYELYNCSCISLPVQSEMAQAINQPCEIKSCTMAIFFLMSFAVVVCLMFICFTMNLSVMLRVIKSSQATAAVSIQALFTKLLGTIPAPIVFGMAIDTSCALWESSPCNPSESKCVFFFTNKLSMSILLICMVPKIIGCLSLVALNFVYSSKHKRKSHKALESQLTDNSVSNSA